MKKIAYVVNHFNDNLQPTERDDICIYLSAEDRRDGVFESRCQYNNILIGMEHAIPPYKMLDAFFMKLLELQQEGYELKFICEEQN